jgi:tetratricopeptide (TPR) repeat protein
MCGWILSMIATILFPPQIDPNVYSSQILRKVQQLQVMAEVLLQLQYPEAAEDFLAIAEEQLRSRQATDSVQIQLGSRISELWFRQGNREAFQRLQEQVRDWKVVQSRALAQRDLGLAFRGRLNDEATLAFEEWVRLTPNDLNASRHLAELLAEVGQLHRAIEIYQSLQNQKSEVISLRLCVLQAELQKLDQLPTEGLSEPSLLMVLCLQRKLPLVNALSLKLQSRSDSVKDSNLLRAFVSIDQPIRNREWLEKQLRPMIESKSAVVQFGVARGYLRLGQFDRAKLHLERVSKNDPSWMPASVLLVQSWLTWKESRYDDAILLYQQAQMKVAAHWADPFDHLEQLVLFREVDKLLSIEVAPLPRAKD